MAKILKNVEQAIALRCVSQNLKELNNIKEFSEESKHDFRLKVMAKTENDDSTRIIFETEESVVSGIINNYRKLLIKKTEKLISENGIGLEKEELELLKQ